MKLLFHEQILCFLTAATILWLGSSVGICAPARSASFRDATTSVFSKHGIDRVMSDSQVTPGKSAERSFTYQSTLNVPSGSSYVIVTDHDDPDCLKTLDKLAQFRSAQIIHLRNFRNLSALPAARHSLIERLRAANPQYVAIVPKIENFSENTLLAFWQVLLGLGDGKATVYPGFLLGRNSQELDALVTRSIEKSKLTPENLNPVVIAQATDQKNGGMRAIQKAEIIEDIFHELGGNCDGLVVRTPTAPPPLTFPQIGRLGTLNAPVGGLVHQLPSNVLKSIEDAHLLLLFGHGSPGMTCSIAVDGFNNVPMRNDVVLCGSCFSCTPIYSDVMSASNGKRPDSLAYRALANGASVFYGHMHENSGFPQLFLAFESLMNGETVGQSYQRVLNCVFANAKVQRQQFVMTNDEISNQTAINDRNDLLFVMIGDPAACPISRPKEFSIR